MVMGWEINLEIMVALLTLFLNFPISDLTSKENNRKKKVRVTWMNTLSLFVGKTTRRRLGFTKVLDH